MNSRCEICKRDSPEGSTGPLCKKTRCQDIYDHAVALDNRINTYTEFFKEHVPSDAHYEEYLRTAGLEENYQKFIAQTEEDEEPVSRRVWFQLNVARIHRASGWTDEFGREFEV